MRILTVLLIHEPDDSRVICKFATTLAEDHNVHALVFSNSSKISSGKIIYHYKKKWKNKLTKLFHHTKVLLHILKNGYDLVIFNEPELIFVAMICKLFKIRIIYDVHENLEKQIKTKDYLNNKIIMFMIKIFVKIYKNLLNRANYVICATPGIYDWLSTIKRKQIIYNYPVINSSYIKSKVFNRYKAIYSGGVSLDRGIQQSVEAIAEFNKKSENKIIFDVYGPIIREREKQCIEEIFNQNKEFVNYFGRVSYNKIQSKYVDYNIGFCLLHPSENYIDSHPIKIYEYLHNGISTIISDFSYFKKYIINTGIYYTNPLDIRAIKGILQNIIINSSIQMRENIQTASKNKYSWETQKFNLLKIVDAI